MRITCPHCGQLLDCPTVLAGGRVQCTVCKGIMELGKRVTGGQGFAAGGGVTGLAIDPGRKYERGDVMNHGGGGEIVDARDVNLRRHIAMKVLRPPKGVTQADVLRFIAEAQVTAQLEHPSIVPIHELGVDAGGDVFYTMKLVSGKTLYEILVNIRTGNAATAREFPLPRLLNIYQRVCDAVAFAHSRNVVHRDLKPSNIMVGEFGEVQVMDWGIAKVLRMGMEEASVSEVPSGGPGTVRRPPPTTITSGHVAPQADQKPLKDPVDTVRKDPKTGPLTVSGEIVGSPGFMAPEQVDSDLGDIDERTDIYALGAILYNILTLRPPIECDSMTRLIQKVTAGDITPPVAASFPADAASAQKGAAGKGKKVAIEPGTMKGRRFPHCPDGLIPESLSAVAMKALSADPNDRYQAVDALQKDIEAYQNGFATSAEKAGMLTLLGKFIRRNKGMFTLAAASVAIIVIGSVAFMIKVVASERKAVRALAAFQSEQEARKKDQLSAAEALVAQSQMAVEKREFGRALQLASSAVVFDPDLPEARMLKAQILIHEGDFEKAAGELEGYIDLCRKKGNPCGKEAGALVALCRKTVKMGSTDATASEFAAILYRQTAFVLSADMEKNADKLLVVLKARLDQAWPQYKAGNRLGLCPDGGFDLSLAVWPIADLTPLKGMPLKKLSLRQNAKINDLSGLAGLQLTSLDLSACSQLADLVPLAGMPLTSLNLGNCVRVRDLSPLKGMPLTSLDLSGCALISDISVLRGMPLTSLSLWSCSQIGDFSPLAGLPLKALNLYSCGKIKDLSPLKEMPLTSLNLNGCSRIVDLSPLRNMPLTSLVLDWCSSVRDLSPLKGMPLTSLNMSGCNGVVDLSPLKGMPLTSLSVGSCAQITDLSPLKGMPLSSLNVSICGQVTDLTPLKGAPLTTLNIVGCGQITDLSPLQGMQISSLSLSASGVADLSPLKGMPFTSLYLVGCSKIRDLRPLLECPALQILTLPDPNFTDIEVLRDRPGLILRKSWGDNVSGKEFWERFDREKAARGKEKSRP